MDSEQRIGDPIRIETRMVGEVEKRFLTGTVLRFDDVGDIGGMFKEKFLPGSLAFEEVRFNVMHERSKLIGRLPGNATLTVSAKSVDCEIEVLDTQEHRDAVANVNAGVLCGWSVEFRAKDAPFVNGVREVRHADLLGVALVDRPVYTATTVAVRDALAAAEQESARVKAVAAKTRKFLV